MNRLPLVLLVAAAVTLTGCSGDSGKTAPTKVASRDAVNPCTLAFDDQQVATPLKPATAAAEAAALDGNLGAGLAADGVCFDVGYEMHTKGWRVTGYRVSAGKGGVTYSSRVPDRVYRTQFDEKTKLATKPLPGLYVPLRGCVDVTARVDLVGPHGVHASYDASATYGRGCAKYTGGPSSGS